MQSELLFEIYEGKILLKELKYFEFRTKFILPLFTSKTVFKERRGVFIKLTTDSGTGWGEASPLPGFSKETVSDVKRTLRQIEQNYRNKNIASIREIEKYPSLNFGIEQAVSSIIIARNGYDAPFGLLPSGEIKINALLSLGNEKDFLENVSAVSRSGYERIKIKIGLGNFEKELKLLTKANELIKGSNIKLRLDANGCWTFGKAKENLEKLKHLDIEYVEDPVSDIDELIRLADISSVPLAADELLLDAKNLELLLESNVNNYVLKPMLIGGLKKTFDIADKIFRKGKEAILSSTFESPLGTSYLAYGAAMFKSNLIHGIPIVKFERSYLKPPYKFENGKIFLDKEKFPPEMAEEKLK